MLLAIIGTMILKWVFFVAGVLIIGYLVGLDIVAWAFVVIAVALAGVQLFLVLNLHKGDKSA
jgi:hypothetical protein